MVGENNPEMYSFTDNWVSDMVKVLSYLCFAFETITPDKWTPEEMREYVFCFKYPEKWEYVSCLQ